MEWKQVGNNYILQGDGFFISYNPGVPNPVSDLIAMLSGKTRNNHETAIVIEDGKGEGQNKYLILVGDHRAKYKTVFADGLPACQEVFFANQQARSEWSD